MNSDKAQIRQLVTARMDVNKAGDVDTELGLMN